MSANKLKYGPDYIVAGPEKTGTTWLYFTLLHHHDVFLLPKKEIYYFWERQELGIVSPLRILKEQKKHFKYLRRHFKKGIPRAYKNPKPFSRHKILIWYFNYYFRKHDLDWYKSQFLRDEGLVAGDITPRYSWLNLDTIRGIKRDFPHLKVIINLRNPADRDWSFVKMKAVRFGKYEASDLNRKIFKEKLDEICLGFSYPEMINNWLSVFGDEQVKVLSFDRFKKNPIDNLRQVSKFIRIDFGKFPPGVLENVNKKVNKGLDIKQEDYMREIIFEAREDEIEELKAMFPELTKDWTIEEDPREKRT